VRITATATNSVQLLFQFREHLGRARLFKSQATEHANRLVKNYSKDEDAVGAVYFLRLRDAALALRGPPAMSRIQHCGRS